MMHLILSLSFMALMVLVGCKPIKVEVCVLGIGYGMCTLADGKDVEKTPEQLENYVCTNAQDFQKLINNCKNGKSY